MEFIEDTLIYKKRYIHQQLVTDYSKTYLITKLKKKETSFGTSYLAILDNNELYELCFIEYNTGKTFVYAEKCEMTCICC
jgi:hypothetical protein